MTAPTTVPTVWTGQQWRPGGYFHDIVGRYTRCGTPVVGHGYVVALAQARSDARQPCPACFSGGAA
jgi:hypothetical protein